MPAPLDVDASLFHCANLQGAILGVGLATLEKAYVDEVQDASSSSKSGDRSARKKRKMEAPPIAIPDMNDDDYDDEDVYFPVAVQGKKAKLGTGYAGDAREDVG